MNIPYALRPALLAFSVLLAACQPQEQPQDQQQDAESLEAPNAAVTTIPPESAETTVTPVLPTALVPLPGMEASAPVLTQKTTISMDTTAGTLVIEVYPQAAPNAAQRFVELVESGFYNDTPISRVVPGFVAQFGINWREPHNARENNNFFNDDPSLFALEPGTLAFAKAGPDTNSTQVFINYAENSHLADPQYNFTVFGKVISGMEAVEAFAVVGEPGFGLDQDQLWDDGGAYLDSLASKPTMIESAVVVP